MKFHTRRLGELVACFLLSCLCISVAFPQVRVALRNAPLGDRVWPHYWKWGDELAEGGVRLVVFGDSWVDDTVQDGEKGKGRSWPGVFCDEVRPPLINLSKGREIDSNEYTNIDKLHVTLQLRSIPAISFISTAPSNRRSNIKPTFRLCIHIRRHKVAPRSLHPDPTISLVTSYRANPHRNSLCRFLWVLGYLPSSRPRCRILPAIGR